MAHPTKFGEVTAASLGLGDLAELDAPLAVASGGTGAATAQAARDALEAMQSLVDPPTGVLRPWWLSNNSGTINTDGTIYSVYLGRTKKAITVANVFVHMTVVGTGAQNAEMALATSPAAPNGSSQELTKLVASGSLDSLTSGLGIKGCSSALNQAVSAGVHLWACMRTAMGSNEPTCLALTGDLGRGYVLQTSGAAALTGLSSWTGSVPAMTNGGVGPLLFATVS